MMVVARFHLAHAQRRRLESPRGAQSTGAPDSTDPGSGHEAMPEDRQRDRKSLVRLNRMAGGSANGTDRYLGSNRMAGIRKSFRKLDDAQTDVIELESRPYHRMPGAALLSHPRQAGSLQPAPSSIDRACPRRRTA